MNKKLQKQEINNMDLQELLNTLANQVAFWQGKNDRYNVPVVNEARNVARDIGRITDDYVGGGMGQAALRGPDALTRQLLLNAALTAGTAGVGKGISAVVPKITPELNALRNYLTNQQVVLHGTPLPVKGNQLIPYAGSEMAQDAAAVFTAHPFAQDAIGDTMRYANMPFGGRGYFPKGMTLEQVAALTKTYQPTVVIGRTPKSNLYDFLNEMPMSKPSLYKSSEPIKIVDRIEAAGKFLPGENDRYNALVQEALKKAGVGTKTSKLLAKIPKKK